MAHMWTSTFHWIWSWTPFIVQCLWM